MTGVATTIREATVLDVDLIATHRERMFLDMGVETAKVTVMTPAFIPWARAALAKGTYLGFLAEEDGVVVGGAGLMIQDWPPTIHDTTAARGYVLNVYVDPAARGRGHARALMARVLQVARERGVRNVTLNASNFGRPLYETLGFVATNEMRLVLEDL